MSLFETDGGTATETSRSKAEMAMRELQARDHAQRVIRSAGRSASPEELRSIALELLKEAEQRGGK